jgi:hypothetical protein
MFKCADVTSESQICKLQNGNESFSHQISYTQKDVFLHPLIKFWRGIVRCVHTYRT